MSMGVVVGDLLGIAEVGGSWDGEDLAAERRVCGKAAVMGKVTGKRRGEIGEAAFLAKVSLLGFGVAKTWGDSDRYDFVVDGGAGLWRVQVKSAHRAGEDGGYNFRAHGHTVVPYRADEIDALVAYVLPEDAWYVFPVSFFSVRVSMNLFPASRRKRSRFEKYREAWWILRGRVGGG
jgi:hypothetical protein